MGFNFGAIGQSVDAQEVGSLAADFAAKFAEVTGSMVLGHFASLPIIVVVGASI
jgi:hypothetical protein